MPSRDAEVLAQSYHGQQQALADATTQYVVAQWRAKMANPGQIPDLRKAANEWLALAVPYILRANRLSRQYGEAFYAANRRIEAPDAPRMTLPRAEEPERSAVTTSLWVVGAMAVVDQGVDPVELLLPERIIAIEGAASRHTQAGGREAIEKAYAADPVAIGYYRIEDADPCYFCAMLMSRGIVFKGDSFDASDDRYFGPGDAKVHDHCGGSLAPAYTPTLTADQQRFKQMWEGGGWNPAINRKGEADTVLGWRQFYDGQRESAAA